MFNYVFYGHTDYMDVLEIQTDKTKNIKNKILFLNHNNNDLSGLYSEYDKVIFYDDKNSYPLRIVECLKQMTDEYIFFSHDIDVILNIDVNFINNVYKFLKDNDFDRVDLKNSAFFQSDLIYEYLDDKTWSKVKTYNNTENVFLLCDKNENNYIYNVNPSIWKTNTLMEIMLNFPNKNYRTIEDNDVQNFTKKYKIFKLCSNNKIECGHFNCINEYMFFHISHNGKFVPLNGYSTVYGQPYWSIKDEYVEIVDKYNLKKSNKWIQ